jgi:hypothetical protein
MRNIAIILFSLLFFISCKEKQNDVKIFGKQNSKIKTEDTNFVDNNESELAKKWLINSIEENLNKNIIKIITTKEYADYKNDALMADSGEDGSLSDQEFEEKWKDKFDTKYAGLRAGFLISGQDYGKIKVDSCKLLQKNSKNEFFFEVVIKDLEFKIDYIREIKVISENKSFLIGDVKEYN